MANNEKKAIIEALSENVLNTRFENIDQATIDITKRRIMDMIGCAIGGARGDGNSELASLVKDWGGKKESTILGFGYQGPAHNVAMVNCIFGRTFDRGPLTNIIDGKRFPNHITETTVPTALAVGEIKDISGKEFITATVVGDDLSARLHIATDRAQPGQAAAPGESQPSGMRGTSDNFGAAAIAGRLLGLNSSQLRQAFGIVAIMLGGGGTVARGGAAPAAAASSSNQPAQKWQGVKDPFFISEMAKGGYEETTSVKLTQGLIAQRGIMAAELAGAGWTGVKDAFFGARGGYYPGESSVNHIERVTEGLGKKYYVEQVFKPYPGGKPTHAPTDAALAIARKNDINVDDIEEVILRLSPPAAAVHYAKPYVVGDYPTMNALWSYYFAVASSLLRKSSKDENYTSELILDPRLQNLIRKVKLGDLDEPRGVKLEVKMKDGRTFTEYTAVASGEPANPLSREELIAKFMEQVEFSRMVSVKNAEKIVDLIENLERLENISQIIELAIKR
jgi:2-methylcitrate dehydratase PrpD